MNSYFKVTLLNDSKYQSTADIVPKETPQGYYCTVYSGDPKLKAHLEKLLQYEAYIPSPGRNDVNFFADAIMELPVNSIYYVNALPEILSWRGYRVKVIKGTHKSFDYEDFSDFTFKSSSQGITYNQKGERVVKTVPTGYVAVHSDGRVVAGGKYLNANIDKEGADWTLVENPHEKSTPEQRSQMKQYMDVGLQEYHPGVEEEAYKERQEGASFHKIESDYTPKGKTLEEHFATGQATVMETLPSSGYPSSLEPGNVVYSPQTGQAFDSKFWPPKEIDYENYEWYVFSGSELSDQEKAFYAPIAGLTPDLIQGVSDGIVMSEKGLDVSAGFKLRNDMLQSIGGENAAIKINSPSQEKLDIKEMLDPGWLKIYRQAKDDLSEITALTKGRIDESLESMKVEGLRGVAANFSMDLYPYQKAIVRAMTTKSQYEKYGGPKGWHGYFLNVKMGLGKTAMVSAANAVLRNQGLLENGTQTTIVTAPNKNVFVWQSEVGKFLGEHAVVIDGDRQDRIAQWEEIVDKANIGELPSFIVVASSKFRYVRSDDDGDSDDAWELDTDAQYMKLLSLGGKTGDKEVKGGHVGVFCVDESAQYVNPDTSRHAALHSIIESVYQGKGLTWTLNGNISGNSATDTISDLSFINKYVRDNFLAIVQEYTMTDRSSTRETKSMGRRRWKDFSRLKDFMYTFGPQIYSLDGRTVAGENYGFYRTEDEITPMGPEWASVYFDAERKLANAAEENQMKQGLGLLSVLINSGMGAVSAQRLFEYDLGTDKILDVVSKVLVGSDLDEFNNQLKNFLDQTTDSTSSMGRVPKKGMPVSERDRIYSESFSPENRDFIEGIVDGWECPYTNTIVRGIINDLQQNSQAGKNMKIGVAGFSKTSIRKIASRLRDALPLDRNLIQVVDGDVPAEDVDKIQKRHQDEKDKNAIALVTGAGVYGLSLPSDRTYRSATWNSSRGTQYEGRFHRKAEQKNIATVVVPEGITQYMKELEDKKGSMADVATSVLVDVDDIGEELSLGINSVTRFLDRLRQYRPRVLGGEG